MNNTMICMGAATVALSMLPALGLLKGISPALSPDLLKVLAEMGHGDEIVFSDAHFPAHTMNARVLRADGLGCAELLKGLAPLFELDSYATPVIMMAPVPGDSLDPKWRSATAPPSATAAR